MKLLCEACEKVVPGSRLRPEGSALVFDCPHCGARNRLETDGPDTEERSGATLVPSPRAPSAEVRSIGVAGAAAQSIAVQWSDERWTREDSTATSDPPRLKVLPGGTDAPLSLDAPPTHCPKCVEPRAPSAMACPKCGLVFANFRPEAVAPRPELIAQWRALLATWSDAQAHEKVMQFAAQVGALAELARLYRIRLALDPKDGPAHAARERIIALAVELPLPKTEPEQRPRNNLRGVQYALFAVLTLAVLGLLFRMVTR